MTADLDLARLLVGQAGAGRRAGGPDRCLGIGSISSPVVHSGSFQGSPVQ